MAMNMTRLAEIGFLPDWLIRMGIRRLLAARLRHKRRRGDTSGPTAELVQSLKRSPVALATDQANVQHYEVPSAFFETVLGPRLKYSSCLYPERGTTLREAEQAMLRLTCERAELEDGMEVLDLGCGWGSLALWVAEKYPRCRVAALSNSTSQRRFIEARAAAWGLSNLQVMTANVTDYVGGDTYDRVMSVEMFEHMRNYETLLGRIAAWLRPAGKLFVHIFCHRETPYLFDSDGDDDWMARHFFTGGLMPSFDLLGHFHRDLVIRRRWQVDGLHYARTCEDWLQNLDANRDRLRSLFTQSGDRASAQIRLQRWRMFIMACAELFRYRGGTEWYVGQYLFEPRNSAATRAGNDPDFRREASLTAQDDALPEGMGK
jgi:cyclopropane-fatty-acyl-phospholipid synthase